MSDCNYLKEVNDQFGHEYGDILLKIVAGTLKEEMPEDSPVIRMGGDEFMIPVSYTHLDVYKRQEHRSAVEWLNNNTNKEINFFLIEIHAYKIGDSLYAPKFEIVEKPNDFIKTGKIQASSGEMNKSQSERLAFWTRFNEVIIERGRPFNAVSYTHLDVYKRQPVHSLPL